jgi:hypothetical protein
MVSRLFGPDLRSDCESVGATRVRSLSSAAAGMLSAIRGFKQQHRIASAGFVLILACGLSGTLSAIGYQVGRQTDSELRFFEPRRPPTSDEALVACPIEYALRSDERNDVIFLGDSTCRIGIDPIRFERLSGLRAFNLGSQGRIGPMGFLITGKGYLSKHPRPKLVILCVAPIAFDYGATEIAERMRSTMQERFEANYGPEVPGIIPLRESVGYFIRRGSLSAWAAASDLFRRRDQDVRDVPIDAPVKGPPVTFRDIQKSVLQARGFCPVSGEHGPRDMIEFPGEPAKIQPEWDRSVRLLAESCQSMGIPLLIRFSPMPNDLSHVKDFSTIEQWSRSLQSAYANVHIGRPTLLWYDPTLCWDHIHLNTQGVAVYMTYLAKEVRDILAEVDSPPSRGRS